MLSIGRCLPLLSLLLLPAWGATSAGATSVTLLSHVSTANATGGFTGAPLDSDTDTATSATDPFVEAEAGVPAQTPFDLILGTGRSEFGTDMLGDDEVEIQATTFYFFGTVSGGVATADVTTTMQLQLDADDLLMSYSVFADASGQVVPVADISASVSATIVNLTTGVTLVDVPLSLDPFFEIGEIDLGGSIGDVIEIQATVTSSLNAVAGEVAGVARGAVGLTFSSTTPPTATPEPRQALWVLLAAALAARRRRRAPL